MEEKEKLLAIPADKIISIDDVAYTWQEPFVMKINNILRIDNSDGLTIDYHDCGDDCCGLFHLKLNCQLADIIYYFAESY